MGLVDVTELLTDPDFTDAVTRIRRSGSANGFGENALTETSETLTVVIGNLGKSAAAILPQGVRISDALLVYYQGEIRNEAAGGYADVIVFGGQRYKAVDVIESWMHMGAGFTATLCIREAVYA